MRLYRDTNNHLCFWCSASEAGCREAAAKPMTLKCCPDCDHGQPVSVVPWCAAHDERWARAKCFHAMRLQGQQIMPCRLEEPARHYVIGDKT